jgi:hypothetical protein
MGPLDTDLSRPITRLAASCLSLAQSSGREDYQPGAWVVGEEGDGGRGFWLCSPNPCLLVPQAQLWEVRDSVLALWLSLSVTIGTESRRSWLSDLEGWVMGFRPCVWSP